ncbi:MAG: capsular polysaccharide biosynthesis protein [Pseudomonadota bacterium]
MTEKKATLTAQSLGLLFRKYPQKILRAHGFPITRLGRFDAVLTWGRGKTYKRAKKFSDRSQKPLWTAEDGFVRSLKTGREGDVALSLMLDKTGVHYDPKSGSDLRAHLRENAPLSEQEEATAKEALQLLKSYHLSKYNAFHLDDLDLPKDYVLVIDQVRNDASIRFGAANAQSFNDMLRAAIQDHPGKPILIKTHPETRAGRRKGYFLGTGKGGLISFYDKPLSPWTLFKHARAVYTVSSLMGLEAIFAGHRPVVFGRPFYAGWGLTDDRHPDEGRRAWCSEVDLFHAAYLKHTFWYDKFREMGTDFFGVAAQIKAEAANWRIADTAEVFLGFRLWKQSFLRRYFRAAPKKRIFAKGPKRALRAAKSRDAPLMRWGRSGGKSFEAEAARAGVLLIQVEDGFIRSAGLGAELRQPYSLIFDDIGIYFDATQPSKLESLIGDSVTLNARALARADALKTRYCELGLSKYNLGTASKLVFPAEKETVLVLGQVADDASITYGADDIATNENLLWAARQDYPKAHIVYKPHPDVLVGLRNGNVSQEVMRATVDQLVTEANIVTLLKQVDRVATISSLGGFEALMHGVAVTCYGTPFYAGWGLTTDKGNVPNRRRARPNLAQLVHAVLIDYPSYWDPITEVPCTPEVLMDRFAKRQFGRRRPVNKSLSWVQSRFAHMAYLWR